MNITQSVVYDVLQLAVVLADMAFGIPRISILQIKIKVPALYNVLNSSAYRLY